MLEWRAVQHPRLASSLHRSTRSCRPLAFGVLLAILAACAKDPQAAAQPARVQATNDLSEREQAEQLAWSRSVQCAEQAERVYARYRRESSSDGQSERVIGFQNHYNRERRRCYVAVAWMSPGKVTPDTPKVYRQVLDAFENREVASATSMRLTQLGQDSYCRAEGEKGEVTSGNCAKAQEYIDAVLMAK